MEIVRKYFPQLTNRQKYLFIRLQPLYNEWNLKINVISRKDISHLYERHILHSLAIAKIVRFKSNTHILDVGTGGGFPGIPLAIMFPDTQFHLVDSTGKKIKVVQAIVEDLGLENVTYEQARAEQLTGKYDFIVSRAVTPLPDFYELVSNLISKTNKNNIPNGILYLKGGDFSEELEQLKPAFSIYLLNNYFDEKFFYTKKIVHIYQASP
ncbi:MAG: 16S rRNA (guanine(527)-N(7))-methyltransferase RsmG [Bacteroidales bacterium]|nr:16S rRNA (guanine(527)-N(7))-methyltransferase RsmG [Bacteroidales bacterium]